MDARRLARLEDDPHHLQAGLQRESSPHDDVINGRPGKHRPDIFYTCPSEILEIGTCNLLHVEEDTIQYPQQEDLLAHASSPVLVVFCHGGLSSLEVYLMRARGANFCRICSCWHTLQPRMHASVGGTEGRFSSVLWYERT